MPVLLLVEVTSAPGIRAPVASVTVPVTVAVSCAMAFGARPSNRTIVVSVNTVFILFLHSAVIQTSVALVFRHARLTILSHAVGRRQSLAPCFVTYL